MTQASEMRKLADRYTEAERLAEMKIVQQTIKMAAALGRYSVTFGPLYESTQKELKDLGFELEAYYIGSFCGSNPTRYRVSW